MSQASLGGSASQGVLRCLVCRSRNFHSGPDGYLVCNVCNTQSQDYRNEIGSEVSASRGLKRRRKAAAGVRAARKAAEAAAAEAKSKAIPVWKRDRQLLLAFQDVLYRQARATAMAVAAAAVGGVEGEESGYNGGKVGKDISDVLCAETGNLWLRYVDMYVYDSEARGGGGGGGAAAAAATDGVGNGTAAATPASTLVPNPITTTATATAVSMASTTTTTLHSASSGAIPASQNYTAAAPGSTESSASSVTADSSRSNASIKRPPIMPHLPCLVYLAARRLRLGLLLSDVAEYVAHGTLPYYSAAAGLPPTLRSSLKPEQLAQLRPWRVLTCERLTMALGAAELGSVLALGGVPPRLTLPWPNTHAACARLCRRLRLNDGMAVCAARLAEMDKKTGQGPLAATTQPAASAPRQHDTHNIPPLRVGIAAYVVLALKLVYRLDGNYERSDHGRAWGTSRNRVPYAQRGVPSPEEESAAAHDNRLTVPAFSAILNHVLLRYKSDGDAGSSNSGDTTGDESGEPQGFDVASGTRIGPSNPGYLEFCRVLLRERSVAGYQDVAAKDVRACASLFRAQSAAAAAVSVSGDPTDRQTSGSEPPLQGERLLRFAASQGSLGLGAQAYPCYDGLRHKDFVKLPASYYALLAHVASLTACTPFVLNRAVDALYARLVTQIEPALVRYQYAVTQNDPRCDICRRAFRTAAVREAHKKSRRCKANVATAAATSASRISATFT